MGHYGRMRFASADGTGRGIELSTSGRLLNSGLVVESVREEAEEGEEGEEEALPAPPSPGVEEGGREEEEAKQGPGSAVEVRCGGAREKGSGPLRVGGGVGVTEVG